MTRRIRDLLVGAFALGGAGFSALVALIHPGPYDWFNMVFVWFDIFAGIWSLGIYFTEP